MNLIIPRDYNPVLNTRDTEIAIKLVKDFFERELAKALNLVRVSAPIMVTPQSGLNDNLNGVERPVSFDILETGETAEIVQSLAKWKRLALRDYGFQPGEGLYTDMNAIRRDEVTDNIHSIFVDQWDWERILGPDERNEAMLAQRGGEDLRHPPRHGGIRLRPLSAHHPRAAGAYRLCDDAGIGRPLSG